VAAVENTTRRREALLNWGVRLRLARTQPAADSAWYLAKAKARLCGAFRMPISHRLAFPSLVGECRRNFSNRPCTDPFARWLWQGSAGQPRPMPDPNAPAIPQFLQRPDRNLLDCGNGSTGDRLAECAFKDRPPRIIVPKGRHSMLSWQIPLIGHNRPLRIRHGVRVHGAHNWACRHQRKRRRTTAHSNSSATQLPTRFFLDASRVCL